MTVGDAATVNSSLWIDRHVLLLSLYRRTLKLSAQQNETETEQLRDCIVSVSFRCADNFKEKERPQGQHQFSRKRAQQLKNVKSVVYVAQGLVQIECVL